MDYPINACSLARISASSAGVALPSGRFLADRSAEEDLGVPVLSGDIGDHRGQFLSAVVICSGGPLGVGLVFVAGNVRKADPSPAYMRFHARRPSMFPLSG